MLAGVSVTAPAYRIDEHKIAEWSQLVRQTAQAIEGDLATRLGPRNRE
jgi:DNA-binding IclR family transcriptional regulator